MRYINENEILVSKVFVFCVGIKTQSVQIVKWSYICQIHYFNKNTSYKTKTHFQRFRGKSYQVQQVSITTKVVIPSHGEVYSNYLDDSVCRWIPTCWLFSLGNPVSFIYITDRHEILLNVRWTPTTITLLWSSWWISQSLGSSTVQLWRHLPCMSTYRVLYLWNLLLCWFYISLV